MSGAAAAAREAPASRYHGLDGLRAVAMLLGVVVHATLPYFSRRAGIEFMWPADPDQSLALLLLFDYIHAWRMPVFFLLAGFFAHLMLERLSPSAFARDRLRRIGVPLVLFAVVMAVLMPALWWYGWKGEFAVDLRMLDPRKWPSLISRGIPLAHLWFLWYLLLLYAALLLWRAARRGVPAAPAIGRRLGGWIYARAPLLPMLAAALLLAARGGDESKPIWPPNVPDLLYAAVFFFYGHGLWSRRTLLDGLRGRTSAQGDSVARETMNTGAPGSSAGHGFRTRLAGLWMAGMLAYAIHVAALGMQDQGLAGTATGIVTVLDTLAYGSAAVLLSLALVGSFQAGFRTPRRWVRWMADSSYWIYLMHLPVVAFLTFWLAHLDASGRLAAVTGFEWGPELKFSVAFVATSVVGMVSYRYLVRYTPLGTLLNGKRERAPARLPS